MCRLFGFRSVIQSQVHRSLVQADNALWGLSEQHPDGWGVAYYIDGTPHLTRSAMTALSDRVFQRVSGVVASETVVAHVRKATQGNLSVLNCHPFQYGRWVFAHNGDIPTFAEHRDSLVAEVHPRLRRFILGDTDSEVLFVLVLTELLRHGPLTTSFPVDVVVEALGRALQRVREVCESDAPCLLTCMITDGGTMLATHGGKELFVSTYKQRCADREQCPSLSVECEAPTRSGFVNHLLFSSEPLSGDNVWEEMSPGEVIGVDAGMKLYRGSLTGPKRLAVVP